MGWLGLLVWEIVGMVHGIEGGGTGLVMRGTYGLVRIAIGAGIDCSMIPHTGEVRDHPGIVDCPYRC